MDLRRLIPASLARKLTGSGTGGIALFAIALQQAGSLAVTLLAARFLLPAEFGVYAIAAIFMLLLQELTFTGVTHFIITQKDDEDRLLSTTFWLILAFSTGGAALLFITAPLLAWLFDAPELTLVLRLMAVAQPLSAYTSWASAILQRRQQMKLHFRLLAFQNFVALVGGVAALLAWQSIFALVIYRYARTLAGGLAYLLFARERPKAMVDFPMLKSMLAYASNLYGSRFLQFFSSYGADLVLGAYLSTASAGIYRLGNRLATLPVELIGQPVRTFALSQFGHANRELLPFTPIARKLVSTMTFLMGSIGATVAVFGSEIVMVLFQPAYMPAIAIAVALIARAIAGVGDSLLEPMLAATGKTGLIFLHRTIWSIAAVAVILVAASFGAVTVAWSLAALMIGASLMSMTLAVRHCGLEWRKIARALARAMAFVGFYAAAIAAIHAAALHWLASPLWVLLAGFAGSAVVGAAILLLALKARVVEMSVFHSK